MNLKKDQKMTVKNDSQIPKKITKKMTLKKSQAMTLKTTQKTTQKILDLIHKNPYITRQELSRRIGNITTDGVKYHLEQFKKQGILKRIGADRGGYWKVIKKLK